MMSYPISLDSGREDAGRSEEDAGALPEAGRPPPY